MRPFVQAGRSGFRSRRLLPLKDNQPTVNAEVTRFMRHVRDADPKSLSYSGTVDKGHGRLCRRRAWLSGDVSWFEN